MNTLFGVASHAGKSSCFGSMSLHAEELFQEDVQLLANPSLSIQCGYIYDGGATLGKAVTDDIFLVYLGTLHKPLPQWSGGSPLDDSDRTAHYLLSRYLKLGPAFLNNISGQYVVALCDLNNSKLFLGCDPGGFRKVFYYENDHQLIFGTSLVSMAGAFENGPQLDRTMENFLLGYEFLPWNRTVYKGITYLPPGTLIEWCDGTFQKHTIKKADFFEPDQATIRKNAEEEKIIQNLYYTFIKSIAEQCPTANRVAVLLGGFDSALVAAGLKLIGKQVETFSFYFEDTRYNQAHTDTLSAYLGTKHTWVPITPEIIKDGLKNFSLNFNQMASQPHYLIQTAHACSTIRQKGYLHCFTGDGCDEVFLGYPTVHSRARLFLRLGVLPKKIVNLLLYVMHWPFLEKRFGHTYRLARNVINILGQRMPVRGHITNRIFDELSLSRLRLEPGPSQEKSVEEILIELAKGLENLSPLRLAFHGKAIPGLGRNKIEGSSNCSGITIQSPFLHPRMLQLGIEIPDELLRPKDEKISAASGKYILMRMAQRNNLLPEEIIYQKKLSPVAAPVDKWYMGPLREFMLSSLSDLPFDYDQKYVRDLLQPKLAEELFRQHVSIGHYAFNAIALLATYASLTK